MSVASMTAQQKVQAINNEPLVSRERAKLDQAIIDVMNGDKGPLKMIDSQAKLPGAVGNAYTAAAELLALKLVHSEQVQVIKQLQGGR